MIIREKYKTAYGTVMVDTGDTPVNEFKFSRGDMDYSGADFSNLDLSGADLSSLCLRFASFQNCNLPGAILSDCNLTEANFSYSDLSEAFIEESTLTGADFTGCNLSGATLNYSDLTKVCFAGAETGLTHFAGVKGAIDCGRVPVKPFDHWLAVDHGDHVMVKRGDQWHDLDILGRGVRLTEIALKHYIHAQASNLGWGPEND